jgi:hypothetical protein
MLAKVYGQQPWILQTMEGIQQCVQNSIDMLSGQPVAGNNLPIHGGGQYQFPARTAAELQATQQEAAVTGSVSAAAVPQIAAQHQAEQAIAAGNVDMFELLQSQAGMLDPASQGMPPKEAISEPATEEWIV